MDIWSVIAQSPLAAWIGYVHLSRPARTECNLKHENVAGKQSDLCVKIESVHTDVREIRELLIQHVTKNK